MAEVGLLPFARIARMGGLYIPKYTGGMPLD
jgi:hypothetical protein